MDFCQRERMADDSTAAASRPDHTVADRTGPAGPGHDSRNRPWPGARVLDARADVAAFPLGGIGTGNVSIGARGEFRDWEISNHADKGTWLPVGVGMSRF
jgi:hypothetical protein